MTGEPAFVAETLAWCNKVRADQNLEPLDVLPKGYRRDPLSCPCGKATGLHVESDGCAYAPGDEWSETEPLYDLPDAVSLFVEQFDLGFLRQYEAA